MMLNKPAPIDGTHDLKSFDCAVPPLNEYLRKYAILNHQNRSSRTFVATHGNRVVDYYTLTAGSASRDVVSPRAAGTQKIPCCGDPVGAPRSRCYGKGQAW